MANTNFVVLNITDSENKEGYVWVEVKYFSNNKVYRYHRRTYYNTVLIDGYRIYFNDSKEVTRIKKEYQAGHKKVTGKISEEVDNLETQEVQATEEQPKFPKVEGEVHHEKYEQIKTCMECGIPVYLAGPAGAGKNHTLEQIAKELGWNFYFSNSVQQEFKLTGFIDAGGTFHETEFSKACKEAADGNDVVFFLDEMDASIPEVLVLLNAAIANGYFEFPDGKVNFGKKVHFVAAGNTVGSGADEMYTGRMVLDQATLDRFAIIEFDYSLTIEMAITNNNSELVSFIRELRTEAANKGIRATFSYRCMTMVTKLEKAGMDMITVMTIAVMKGLDKDTVNTFNPTGSTKYHEALRKVQRAA